MSPSDVSTIDDVRIDGINDLVAPNEIIDQYPVSPETTALIQSTRRKIGNIMRGDDKRLLVVIGPCSIHDPKAALEYGQRLVLMREKYADQLEVVMRVYFEKPRTTVGWKGLINDPYMDNSFQLNDGLRTARKLLVDLNDLGIPTAGEYLDMITPQYVADMMCWGAIGARTTESQVHRELASGLSCPVGFKNGTDGTIKVAIDAIGAANAPHHFLSVTKFGHSAIVSTKGNPDCHIILRGGKVPNFSAEDVSVIQAQLTSSNLADNVMIDFSHANSAKDYRRQMLVAEDVASQISAGNKGIFGVMVESNLVEGRQDIVDGKVACYGQSVTDACIGWSDTESLLATLSDSVIKRRGL